MTPSSAYSHRWCSSQLVDQSSATLKDLTSRYSWPERIGLRVRNVSPLADATAKLSKTATHSSLGLTERRGLWDCGNADACATDGKVDSSQRDWSDRVARLRHSAAPSVL